MLLENPDDYFDEKPREAFKVWKRFTLDQLKAFVKTRRKGKLYSSVDLGIDHIKHKGGIVFKYKGLEYHIELK